MNLSFTERVEIAIAKHWPDLYRVCEVTGASPVEVRRVLARMDEFEPVTLAPLALPDGTAGRAAKRRAHAEYERLRQTGLRIADMPAWVQIGHREYDREFRAARRVATDPVATGLSGVSGRPGTPIPRQREAQAQATAV